MKKESIVNSQPPSPRVVASYDPIPLSEYPQLPFRKDDLPLWLQKCLLRAIRLGDIELMGEVPNMNGKTSKIYIVARLSHKQLLKAHAMAETMGVRKCLHGKEKGTGVYPAGQLTKEQRRMLQMVFTPDLTARVLKETRRIIDNMKAAAEYTADGIRTAWWSDGIGSIIASTAARIINHECGIGVRAEGNNDSHPDLVFPTIVDFGETIGVIEGFDAELKVMVGSLWQGGEYSNEKRLRSPTFLVSRNHECTKFWVGMLPATAWESNIKQGNGRYATKASWDWVRKNPLLWIIYGDIGEDGKMILKDVD
jgi:hypothetical protein